MPVQAISSVPVVRPPRFNLAGFCLVCVRYQCTDLDCVATWGRLEWVVCAQCGGSAFEDYFECGSEATRRCDWCTGGLVGVGTLPSVAVAA